MVAPVITKRDEARLGPSDLKRVDRDDPEAKTDAHDKETQFKTQAHAEFNQGGKPDLFVSSDIRSEIKSALSTLKTQEKVEEASLASVHAQTTDKAFRAAARGEITTAEAEAIIAEGNMRDSAVRRTSYDSDLEGNLSQPNNDPAIGNAIAQDRQDPLATAGARPEGPNATPNAQAIQLEQEEGLLVQADRNSLTSPASAQALEALPLTKEQELASSLRGIIQDLGMLDEEREAELLEVPLSSTNNLSEKQAAAIDLRAYGREQERTRGVEVEVAEEMPVELNLERAELEAVALENGNGSEPRAAAELAIGDRLETGAREQIATGQDLEVESDSRVAIELKTSEETELEKVKVGETREVASYEAVDLDVDFGRSVGSAPSTEPSTKDIANEMRAKLDVDTRQQEDIDRETLAALDRYFERESMATTSGPVNGSEPQRVAEQQLEPSPEQGRVEFDFGAKPVANAQPSMSFVVREEPAPSTAAGQQRSGDFRSSVAASGELAALEAKVEGREVKLEDDTLNFNFSMNA